MKNHNSRKRPAPAARRANVKAAKPAVEMDYVEIPAHTAPCIVVAPLNAIEFAHLLHAAQRATVALDNFLQSREPSDADYETLMHLRSALTPYQGTTK